MRPRAIIIIVQTMFPNTSEHYYSRGEKVEVDHVCLGQDNLRQNCLPYHLFILHTGMKSMILNILNTRC